MKIVVAVKPRAKSAKVEKIEEGYFRVSVREAPVDGKANEGVIQALAGYFEIAPSKISLTKGHTSKLKIFEVSV